MSNQDTTLNSVLALFGYDPRHFVSVRPQVINEPSVDALYVTKKTWLYNPDTWFRSNINYPAYLYTGCHGTLTYCMYDLYRAVHILPSEVDVSLRVYSSITAHYSHNWDHTYRIIRDGGMVRLNDVADYTLLPLLVVSTLIDRFVDYRGKPSINTDRYMYSRLGDISLYSYTHSLDNSGSVELLHNLIDVTPYNVGLCMSVSVCDIINFTWAGPGSDTAIAHLLPRVQELFLALEAPISFKFFEKLTSIRALHIELRNRNMIICYYSDLDPEGYLINMEKLDELSIYVTSSHDDPIPEDEDPPYIPIKLDSCVHLFVDTPGTIVGSQI